MLSVYQIFTPSMPAKEAFVERAEINDRLVDAIRTPGKQIIIYGHSGSGKTTLIERKLFEVYERHVTVSCIKGMTFNEVLLDAFDQLDPYFVSSVTEEAAFDFGVQISKLWLEISAAKSSMNSQENHRILPPQLTVQNLARLIGAIKACWVLEDFHKLEGAEKEKLAQSMKMFMDAAKVYPEIKAVAVGAVSTAREVVAYDSEMTHRVAEIKVPLMSDCEIKAIINSGARKLGVKFEPKVSEMIVNFSNGIPSICHQLCLSACNSAGFVSSAPLVSSRLVKKIDLEIAVREFVESASDSMRNRFDKAIRRGKARKYDNYSIILRGLCELGIEGGTTGELASQISSFEPNYPANNIARYLDYLTSADRGSVLLKDPSSGRYFYADPFVRSYAQAYFKGIVESKKGSDSVDDVLVSFEAVLFEIKRSLEGARMSFGKASRQFQGAK